MLSWPISTEAQSPAPPVAKIIPHPETLFGDVRNDNYYWLKDKSSPEVIKYLEEENAYTQTLMKPTENLQEDLYKELLGRIKETDLTVPHRIDDYYYYSRTEQGKNYPIYCRKKGSLEAPEKLILDVNALAEGHKFFSVGAAAVSPNHNLMAFSTDTTGSETYTLFVKDLTSGQLLTEQIPNTYYGVQWGNDNQTFFYITLDDAKRPYKLFRHRLGADYKNDQLIHHEADEAFYVNLSKTRSRKYLLLALESNTTTEVRYLDADSPDGDFQLIHPRQHEMEYSVDHQGDKFFILTNENAKNFKLLEAPVANPAKAHWKEIIPHNDSVKLDKIEAFQNHLVIYEREKGLRKIHIKNLATGQEYDVKFPEPAYVIWPSINPEFKTNQLRFEYSSLVTPRTVYDYNMDTQEKEIRKQYEVLGGYDPAQYESERIFAQAKDGTSIPISLVYKKGTKKDGSHPLYLYGYGSYGASIDAGFNSNRLSLLDRGFIYAIAHIRGGGEMGRYWYDLGKLLNKKNTFTDFIACAEHLINKKYTSKDKLVISGGSAGGLLIGAVTNLRPDLFRIVVAKVPFVDVLNTMLDPSIPLTVTEYEEWGNPNQKEHYDYMKSYSPYDNITAKTYPTMLVTAGLNDPRVGYWEPAKWTAKLRALKTDKNLLLLKVNMGAGHGGPSGRYEQLKENAFEFAFIFDQLGIKK
jgi:oligopeptidase B